MDVLDGYPDANFNIPDHLSMQYPWPRQTDHGKSGISMSVTGVQGARKGSETKPKNMNVVYVMKVC